MTHDICRFLLYLDVYRIIPAGGREMRDYGCRQTIWMYSWRPTEWQQARLDDKLWRKLQFMEITRRIISLTLPRTRLRNDVANLRDLPSAAQRGTHPRGLEVS